MRSQASLVCGVVLLRDDGAALLQLRDNKPDIPDAGIWVFPGGHVESGETPANGARREFLEETLYPCEDIQHLVSFQTTAVGSPEEFLIMFFWSRFDGRHKIVCCEGQELRFVKRDEIGSMPRRPYLTEVWDLALSACGIGQKRED